MKNVCFYKESKKISTLGLIVLLSVTLVYIYYAGYVYSLLSWYNPIVYISILIPIITAAILASILVNLIPKTHNRNRKSQLVIALLSGLLLSYFTWASYIAQLMNEVGSIGMGSIGISQYNKNLFWLFDSTTFELLSYVKQEGMIEIMGIPIKGALLFVVWIIEALMLIAIPAFIIIGSSPSPYSERLGKAYKSYLLDKEFEFIFRPEESMQKLSQSANEYIQLLEHGTARKNARITIYYEEQEAKSYLSIHGFTMNEKKRYDEEELLINFEINSTVAKLILNTNKNKSQKYPILKFL